MKLNLTRRSFLKAWGLALPVFDSLLPGAQKGGAALRSRLGIITDEIAQELEQALDFISGYNLNYCELRELWHKNIMDCTQTDLDRARKFLQNHKLKVSDIASPVLKWNLPGMPAREAARDTFGAHFTDADTQRLLLRSFELARFFGTGKVRIFSFWRAQDPQKAYPYVRDRLAKVAEVAAKHDMVLVSENEHTCNVATGQELGRILRDVNSPNLRGNWDPGNAAMLGEVPYPDGYNAVKGLFAHVHIKDVKKDGQSGKLVWAPVGGGFIDWKGQLKALRDDGYQGTLSLETHYRRADHNLAESTRESLQGLLKILDAV